MDKINHINKSISRHANLESLFRGIYMIRKNVLALIGIGLFLSLLLMCIFAPWLAPYPEDAGDEIHLSESFKPPSLLHICGTDQMGRDIFSRIIFGGRNTLLAGLIIPLIGASMGCTLGLIAGYIGRKTGTIIMRITDIFLSIPSLIIALLVIGIFGPSLKNIIIALSINWWPWYARLLHGQVISLREETFVEASKLLGAKSTRIMFSEILPNAIPPIIVKITLDMGYAILSAAALGFLGLGILPPIPEWGLMISQGRLYLPRIWWITTMPGIFIFLAVFSINLIGDGLRDIFDVEVM